MTTILPFDQSRCRKASPARYASKAGADTAQVLLFTGVRREPLSSMAALPAPVLHEPMFDDTAPDKPTGKKKRRGKAG